MKVPVILARYRLAAESGQSDSGLAPLVERAITESDNAAALALFQGIEAAKGGVVPASRYVQTLLRQSGDKTTVVNTVSGLFKPAAPVVDTAPKDASAPVSKPRRC